MKKIYTAVLIVVLFSCTSVPSSEKDISPGDIKGDVKKETGATGIHRFILNPAVKAVYRYLLNNDSEITMEINGNETTSINNAEAETNYTVNKDSTGNFVFNIRYDKIKIHTKKDDVETDADADNAALSVNPVEKMLGILKEADITAIVGANGEVKDIKGYKELGERMTGGFAPNDVYGRDKARSQWEKLIGGSVFQGGIDKLFTVLPDSTINTGGSWTLTSKQAGEIPINIKSIYTLKEIKNGIAIIESVGDISSAGGSSVASEPGNIKSDIRGKQKTTIKLNIKTGMVIANDITTQIKGTIQSMGVNVPVSIRNVVKIRQLQ